MFGDYDDDDGECCVGCGIRMDVIGPPGPQHLDDCPYKAPAQPDGPNLSEDESDYLFGVLLGTELGFRMLHMSDAEALETMSALLRKRKDKWRN
jgi:hypothetical protein